MSRREPRPGSRLDIWNVARIWETIGWNRPRDKVHAPTRATFARSVPLSPVTNSSSGRGGLRERPSRQLQEPVDLHPRGIIHACNLLFSLPFCSSASSPAARLTCSPTTQIERHSTARRSRHYILVRVELRRHHYNVPTISLQPEALVSYSHSSLDSVKLGTGGIGYN